MAIKYLSSISLEGNEIQNVKLHPLASAPTGAEGQVYYDTTANKIYAHNGSAWYSINGDVESVASGNANAISIGGTAEAVTIDVVTAAVTDGSLKLVTGNDVFDYVTAALAGFSTANDYVDSASFNSGNGELTLSVSAQSDVVVDLDGRYLTSFTQDNDFATIEVNGQSDVNAASQGDAVEFSASGGMTITTSGSQVDFSSANDNDIDYVNAASFNSSNGELTLSGVGNAGATVDLDGRYLQSFTESNDYGTIAVSGQTSVDASSAGDTVTFVGAGGVSITTGTDEVTFTSANDNDYVDGATFSSANGELTLSVSGQSDVTVDLDGRYLTSYSETDTLDDVTGRGATTSNAITVGGMTVNGDLTVSGAVTTKMSETVLIEDNLITLNSNETGTPTENGGMEIERGTAANASLFWSEASDAWFHSDGSNSYALLKTGDFNPTIGTDTDVSTGALTVIDSLTLTDGVITAAGTRSIQSASTGQKGVVELATNTETATGTSAVRAVTPAGLNSVVADKLLDVANHFSTNVGDGTNATIEVTHGMNTRDVNVQVYDNDTFDTVFVETVRNGADTVQLLFATAPSSDAYSVVISKHYR